MPAKGRGRGAERRPATSEEQSTTSRTGGPSLATVAASAGVSVATVSKVVNGRSDVGPETRARVQDLLEQHAYVGRRSEATSPSKPSGPDASTTVELVFHGDLTGYALAILDGVLEAGDETGVTIAVSRRARNPQAEGQKASNPWVRSLARARRAAVVDVVDDLEQGDLAALARSRLPLVVIDPLSLPRPDVPSIGTTNFSGGLTATQHLLSLGHRRIAYLGATSGLVFNQARMHGYRAALEAAGVVVPETYVLSGDYDYDGGVTRGSALLDLPDRPTAVFAATDESAAGLFEAARSRGLRVPEDLSVVGFDDAPLARLMSPPLTTVRQPLREMGRAAVRTALRLAAGDTLDSHHVELATELVVRSSTAPPPADPVRDR